MCWTCACEKAVREQESSTVKIARLERLQSCSTECKGHRKARLEGGAVLRNKKGLYSLEGPWAGDKYDLLGS